MQVIALPIVLALVIQELVARVTPQTQKTLIMAQQDLTSRKFACLAFHEQDRHLLVFMGTENFYRLVAHSVKSTQSLLKNSN